MKKFLIFIFVVTMVFSAIGTANAWMIGDTIFLAHYFPDLSFSADEAIRTVEAGTGDQWIAFEWVQPYYIVNPEDTFIEVDYLRSGTWYPESFNGLGVSDIDSTILGVTIDTNIVGWDSSRLTYGDHFAQFNWQGLPFTTESYFDIYFNFGQGSQNPIPEPATMLLLGSGLFGLAGIRRRKR